MLLMPMDQPGPSVVSSHKEYEEENGETDEEGSSSDSEETGSEDEAEAAASSSDSESGNSVSCPICLLKIKGQAIGTPDVCGHPFCLDCIVEWAKNVSTCPIDRKEFTKVLVRLELNGDVIKEVPIKKPGTKETADVYPTDHTNCQICGRGDHEESLLLCDGCDMGFHTHCLTPPLEYIPIDDWYCASCSEEPSRSVEASPRPRNRNRAPLTLRVRREVLRNRRRAYEASRTQQRKKKKQWTTRRKTKSRKQRGSVRQGRVSKKKLKVPSPRKNLAEALGISSSKHGGITCKYNNKLSIFGDDMAFDVTPGNEESFNVFATADSRKPKSLVAQLAENRKVKTSIYNFGPAVTASIAQKPRSSVKKEPVAACSSSSVDLLGSIMASQESLTKFGKNDEDSAVCSRNPVSRSKANFIGAILASQASLKQLGATKARPSNEESSSRGTAPANSESSTVSSSTVPSKSASRGSSSSKGGVGGDGEDPDDKQEKKKLPEDGEVKREKPQKDEEEDVDLYNDIEEPSTAATAPSDGFERAEDVNNDRNDDLEEEKSLVIDDTNVEETETKPQEDKDDAESSSTVKKAESSEKAVPEKDEIPKKVVALKPQPQRFLHGGLPAAAAALSMRPRVSGGSSKSASRPRTASQSLPAVSEASHPPAPSLLNDSLKSSLVSSIASALKETLTSVLLERSLSGSSSEPKDQSAQSGIQKGQSEPPDEPINQLAPSGIREDRSELPEEPVNQSVASDEKLKGQSAENKAKTQNSAVVSSGKAERKKNLIDELFGDEENAKENNPKLVQDLDDLEQISDCEEGELDESDVEREKENPQPEIKSRSATGENVQTRRVIMVKNGDFEEGEIVEEGKKKKAKKKKKNKKSEKEESIKREEAEEKILDDDVLKEAGIGGERKVEVSLDEEGLPATFKKISTSTKTRHYRHQGEVKNESQMPEESKKTKREELKRYDVRRVVQQKKKEKRSRTRTRSRSKSRDRLRDRSGSRSVSRQDRLDSDSRSRKKHKHRSRTRSPSPRPKSKADKDTQRTRSSKRSRTRSRSRTPESKKRKREDKKRDKRRTSSSPESVHLKPKEKEKKKKKEKHKEKTKKDKEKEKEKKATKDSKEIEIPSKAVFASGDKIVVSLHFAQNAGTPTEKSSNKKRKSKSSGQPASKEEAEDSRKMSMTPEIPASKEKEKEKEKEREEKREKEPKSPQAEELPSKTPTLGNKPPTRGGARGRGRMIPRRRGVKTQPVLIDIETSEVIPLAGASRDEVIVLSDSDEENRKKEETSKTPPLPPLPPPPPASVLAAKTTPSKPAASISRGLADSKTKGKPTGVKFSLTSKTLSLKKVSNAVFAPTAQEEDEEEAPPSPEPKTKTTYRPEPIDQGKAATSKETREAGSTVQATPPLPQALPPSAPPRKNVPSPIFRPSPPASTAAYDPFNPTRSPSTPTPSPPSATPPPLPPPTALQSVATSSSLPQPHPGAVLIPPMTSLPPPPLPPSALLPPPPAFTFPSGLLPNPQAVFGPGFKLNSPANLLLAAAAAAAATPGGIAAFPSAPPPQPSKATPAKPSTPPSPSPSEGSDIFGPPSMSPPSPPPSPPKGAKTLTPAKPRHGAKSAHPGSAKKSQSKFEELFGSKSSTTSSSHASAKPNRSSSSRHSKPPPTSSASATTATTAATATGTAGVGKETAEEIPSSAVDLQVKEKFLKKLNRQERVVEEVRLALKPYYTSKKVSKEDYKEILRKCVPKICHTKSGEINPIKIKEMVKAYVKKFRYLHKKETAPKSE